MTKESLIRLGVQIQQMSDNNIIRERHLSNKEFAYQKKVQ